MVALANLPMAKVPKVVELALAASTRKEHQRILAKLRTLPNDLADAPADIAVTEWLSRLRSEHKWRWSSTLKNTACLQGALKILPVYRLCRSGLLLNTSPIWAQFCKATSKMARAELPNQPKAITAAQVRAILALPASARESVAKMGSGS